MDLDQNKIMNRLMLRLKVNSLSHCGLVAPLILYELFTLNGTNATLTQGHCVVNKQPNWHLWVTSGEENFDISALMVVQSGLDKIEYHKNIESRSDSTPGSQSVYSGTGCSCDLQQMSGSLDLVSQWELYKESPAKYWAQVPMKTQSVRRDILKRFKAGNL
jgi:hypothetical protein